MKSIIQTILLFSILLFFSSCFEILEEVNMNSDGSGDVLLTINMSESKQNLNNYLKMEEVNGQKIPKISEMKDELDRVKKILDGVKGISDIKITTDFQEYIFKIRGDFINVAALNKAINTLAEKLNRSPYPTIKEDNFAFSSNQFTRLFDYDIDAKEYDNLDFKAKMMLESARLVSVYRFSRSVTEVSNPYSKVSPSKKAVMLKSTLADLIKGDKSIKNKVSF